jgi:hypothetical protein
LPASLLHLVGRDELIADVARLVREHRQVTLRGSGGIGKTSVALWAGARVLRNFPDGVWVVDLLALTDAGLVAAKVAAELGIRQTGDRSLRDVLGAALKRRKLLLILDSCEHVVAEVASLTEDLLRDAPGIHILATTREAFNAPAECVYDVGPLSYPDPAQALGRDDACRFGSVELFVQRAIRALRAEAVATKISNDYTQVVFYLNLAAYRLVSSESDGARAAAREALKRACALHYPLYTAIAVGRIATVAALRGDVRPAARLRGFVDEVYRTQGVKREPNGAATAYSWPHCVLRWAKPTSTGWQPKVRCSPKTMRSNCR